MIKHSKQIIAAGLTLACLSLTTTSCSSLSDRDRVKIEGTSLSSFVGAAAGVAVGIGVGTAVSEIAGTDGAQSRLIGGVIGGVVGLFQGYKFGQAWTESVIRKKESYANNEAYLKDNIEQLQYRNKETLAQINQLNSVMSGIQSKQRDKLTKKDARAISDYARCGVKLIDKDLATARKIKASSSNANDIARLKNEIATLSKQRAALQSQSNRILSSSYCV